MSEMIDHPCVQHKLAIIRDVETGHKRFRELATEITKFICYEALKNIKTKEVTVQTPVAAAKCHKIDTDLVVVPILRAGIGMLEGILELQSRNLEKNIADMEKALENDRKLLQESNKLNTNSVKKKREEIAQQVEIIEEKRKEREEEKQILGQRGEEQPGIFTRAREGVGNFVEEYVPQPIADIGNAMVEGFMAPINAVKELGRSFGQLLKPLKALRPLFTGLLGSLKKFALGLKASVVAMLPQIAIAGLIVLALGGLYLMLKKAKEFFKFGDGGPGSAGDLAGETYMPDETPVADPNDFGSKQQRVPIVDQQTKEIIQPDDPRYNEIYERDRGMPAPVQGQTYMGDGKVSILPVDKDGVMNPVELRNMEAEGFKLKPNPLLNPIEKKETGDSANISNTNSSISVRVTLSFV